jgi:RNA recognition motif-containing protein
MSKRIYIENLPARYTEREVKALFSKYGRVSSVSKRSGGMFYVEMSSGADEAIRGLNQSKIGRSSLNVKAIPFTTH